MMRFDALPAIPASYPRLASLTKGELLIAREHAYVEDVVDPSKDVRRSGKDFSFNPIPTDDVADWRTRIFLVWFCFFYENLSVLRRPMAAIEELILEFKAPAILDSTAMRLGTIYAGAGASAPLSTAELQRELALLLPSYKCAVALLVPTIDNAGVRS